MYIAGRFLTDSSADRTTIESAEQRLSLRFVELFGSRSDLSTPSLIVLYSSLSRTIELHCAAMLSGSSSLAIRKTSSLRLTQCPHRSRFGNPNLRGFL